MIRCQCAFCLKKFGKTEMAKADKALCKKCKLDSDCAWQERKRQNHQKWYTDLKANKIKHWRSFMRKYVKAC